MSTPSTPKPSTSKAAGMSALTARETEILSKAWGCLKSGPPEVDYERLATALGMANHRSAANAWSLIKKKLAMGSTAVATPGSSAKTTGGKRKKMSAINADDIPSEDDELADTPAVKKPRAAAKPRAAKKGKAAIKTDEGEGDEAKEAPVVKEEEEDDVNCEDDDSEGFGGPGV